VQRPVYQRTGKQIKPFRQVLISYTQPIYFKVDASPVSTEIIRFFPWKRVSQFVKMVDFLFTKVAIT